MKELESLRSIPKCICDKPCTCALSKIYVLYRDYEYVMSFLKTLRENYNTVETQILLMEQLPNINKVFSLVIQHERQILMDLLVGMID